MSDIEMAATAWASLFVRQGIGALVLVETEDGDIGVFVGDEPKARGTGDTVAEALEDAHQRWHEAWPPEAECRCIEMAEQGDTLDTYRPPQPALGAFKRAPVPPRAAE